MEKLTTLTGVGVPLRRSNVDTDQIIPAVFLKRVTKSGFDDALFYAWRRDPNFVLNKPEYAGHRAELRRHLLRQHRQERRAGRDYAAGVRRTPVEATGGRAWS